MTGSCPNCTAPLSGNSEICPYCGVTLAKAKLIPEKARSAPPTTAARPALSVERCARLAFLALLAIYSFRLLSHPIASNYIAGTFLHLVLLPFHEAGHVLFSFLGRFIQVAGGTLMQLIVPAVVAVSFVFRGDGFGAAIGAWWFGASMADVAPYADDARAGQLPLLGGVTGSEVEDYHDWEVMLGKLGVLSWDHAIGRFFFVAGGVVMAGAIIHGALFSSRRVPGCD